jgi:signal transduction histidine kinase
MADPEQLKEVLVNLIINACEEMGGDGTIVIEEAVSGRGEAAQAVLRLSDSGNGIDPSLAEKVFQPFFTTKEEGTGLGLSIAARIMKEHGGSLTLDSGTDAGATFIVTLPLKEPEDESHTRH